MRKKKENDYDIQQNHWRRKAVRESVKRCEKKKKKKKKIFPLCSIRLK